MYKILLLVSKRNDYKSLYRFYCVQDEEGNIIPYSTSSFVDLQQKINELLEVYGRENLLVVHDLNYDTWVDIDETQCQGGTSGMLESDVIKMYNDTRKEIFGNG